MDRILSGKLNAGKVTVHTSTGEVVTAPLSPHDMLLISENDCTVLAFERVPLSLCSRRMRGRVQRLVETAYPGRISDAAFDYLGYRRQGHWSILAVVLARASLEAYDRRAGRASLGVLSTPPGQVPLQCLHWRPSGQAEGDAVAECAPLATLQPRLPPKRALFDRFRPQRARRRAGIRLAILSGLLIGASLLLELALASPHPIEAKTPETRPSSAVLLSGTTDPATEALVRELGQLRSRSPRRLYPLLEAVFEALPSDASIEELDLREGELRLILLSREPMAFLSTFSRSRLVEELAVTESGRAQRPGMMQVTVKGRLR